MLRRRILPLIVMILIIFVGKAFAETEVRYDMAKGAITVSGNIDVNKDNKYISINILKPNKTTLDIEEDNVLSSVLYSCQTEADEDGSFNINCEMDCESGYYTVYYYNNTTKGTEIKTVYCVNKEDNKNAINALNNASNYNEILNAFNEYEASLCFDCELEGSLDKSNIAKRFYEEIKNNKLDITNYLSASNMYNKACVYEAVYQGIFVDFSQYEESLNLSEAKTYEWYKNYFSSNFNKKLLQHLKGKNYKNSTEFRGFFDEAVITSVVYMPNGVANVKKIIEEFNGTIGITSPTSNDTIYKLLASRDFNSYEDLVKYYNELVDASTPTKKQSSGGGGGFGGGYSSMTVETKKEEQKLTDISSKYTNVTFSGEEIVYKDSEITPWAKEAVASFSARGIVSGDENGFLNPDKNVTREEFAKLLVLAFEIGEADTDVSFDDLSKEHWSYQYVKNAYCANIIKGKGNNFGTGEFITREDMAVMISNALKAVNVELSSEEKQFSDEADISDYAKKSVRALVENGIIKDNGFGYFKPKSFVTRAHAIYYIFQALGKESK